MSCYDSGRRVKGRISSETQLRLSTGKWNWIDLRDIHTVFHAVTEIPSGIIRGQSSLCNCCSTSCTSFHAKVDRIRFYICSIACNVVAVATQFLYMSLINDSRLLQRRANARNVSYTPNLTGEKHTISTLLIKPILIQFTRQRRENWVFFKTSLPVFTQLKIVTKCLNTLKDITEPTGCHFGRVWKVPSENPILWCWQPQKRLLLLLLLHFYNKSVPYIILLLGNSDTRS